jgi:2-iminobutanoate/2-iminopropanoate deaminase
MPKTILQSAKVSPPGGIMSQGVSVPAGKMVFVSGQVARDLDGSVAGVGDVTTQTRKVLRFWPSPGPPWTTWSKSRCS